MVFDSQRESRPETKAATPIMAAFKRGTHHKFQAVAGIEQREEAQHNEVSAGQPVPHQGKSANKEAKERKGTVGQMQQALGDRLLLRKMR